MTFCGFKKEKRLSPFFKRNNPGLKPVKGRYRYKVGNINLKKEFLIKGLLINRKTIFIFRNCDAPSRD